MLRNVSTALSFIYIILFLFFVRSDFNQLFLPWVIILKISKNYYKEIKYFNRSKIIAFRKDICTQMKDHRSTVTYLQ